MHQYRAKMILHTGSMFSGKTSSLWRDLNRFKIAKYKTIVFKSSLDKRYGATEIVTHDQQKMKAIPINSVSEIETYLNKQDVDIIGIDEVQFLQDTPRDLVEKIDSLLKEGYTLVIAGLDIDYLSRPFELVKELMPRADYLYKHHAVCAKCGLDAWVSHRKVAAAERIIVGASEVYEPLCRLCWQKEQELKNSED